MAMFTAMGARFKPITMMMGPVTTGGMILCKNPAPRMATTPASKAYITPVQNSAPMVAAVPQVCTL